MDLYGVLKEPSPELMNAATITARTKPIQKSSRRGGINASREELLSLRIFAAGLLIGGISILVFYVFSPFFLMIISDR